MKKYNNHCKTFDKMLEKIGSNFNYCEYDNPYVEFQIKFIKNKNTTICNIKFGKIKAKGVAKLSPEDNYDEEKGKKIAYLKAQMKLAKIWKKSMKDFYKKGLKLIDNFSEFNGRITDKDRYQKKLEEIM